MHSFKSLLSSVDGNEAKFSELVIGSMKNAVPSWANSSQTMASDIRRSLQYVNTKHVRSKSEMENLLEEAPSTTWEISFSDIHLGKKVAEGLHLVFCYNFCLGAFGEVFKGELWGKTVAVKRLKLNYQQFDQNQHEIITNLQQESAVMSSLRFVVSMLYY